LAYCFTQRIRTPLASLMKFLPQALHVSVCFHRFMRHASFAIHLDNPDAFRCLNRDDPVAAIDCLVLTEPCEHEATRRHTTSRAGFNSIETELA